MGIFRIRNFSIMFAGRILTNVGDSLYAVAAMWLVYDLGGSTLYTGLAGFLSIVPRMIQLLSGPLIDRLNVKNILVYTQLIQGLLLLLVPISYAFGFLSVGLVLAVTPVLSTCNMFVYPAQMAALPKILPSKFLTQGNSLFSIAYQGIDVACNALSGILIVMVGAVSLYLWNAAGFFIGAFLFAMLRIPSSKIKAEAVKAEGEPPGSRKLSFIKSYGTEVKEGISMLVASPLSRLLWGIIFVNAAGGATFTVLPAVSDHLGGPEIYGALLMAQALGSLAGALAAPYLRLERMNLGTLYSAAFIVSGLAWSLCIFCPWQWLTVAVFGFAWFPGGITNVIIFTVIQKGVPSAKLGTVFAASTALSGIAMPLGSLAGGYLGLLIDGTQVIFLCGITIALVGVFWSFDRVTRTLPPAQAVDETLFAGSGVRRDHAAEESM